MMKRFLICLAAAVLLLGAALAENGEPLYPAIQDGLWGWIDGRNEWVIPPAAPVKPGYWELPADEPDAAAPAGLHPCRTEEGYVLVDAAGNVAAHLGAFRSVSEFVGGVATAAEDMGRARIIDVHGHTVLDHVAQINDAWDDAPEMRNGWTRVAFHQPGRDTFAGFNFMNAGGELMYPAHVLHEAGLFFGGRALVGVMLPDYSLVYAHIDAAGRIVWAEDGVDAAALQAQLDQGVRCDPADMTAEEARAMLTGDWSITGGGQHLAEVCNEDGWWMVPLRHEGAWRIRRTDPGEPWYASYDFVLMIDDTDESGRMRTEEMALAIDHRDAFRVFQKESGSAYARYKSRYDEIWMLEQAEGAE